ncbi:hypothetical protein ACTFIV_004931 [Dictyostelium citrinum]
MPMTSSIADINIDTVNKEIIRGLLKLPENQFCGECGMIEPQWASVNLGIFICLSCAGLHRRLGTHISRVKSCELDNWSKSEIETFKETTNLKAKEYWEASLPSDFIRPTYADSNGLKEAWIRCKYEDKAFVPEDVPGAKRLNFSKREGYVYKKGIIVKNWKRRFMKFIGDDRLEYFKNEQDKTPCGSISLHDCGQIDSIQELEGRTFCFIISTPKRRFLISCDNYQQLLIWIINTRLSSKRNSP